jgi:hypothetical protein
MTDDVHTMKVEIEREHQQDAKRNARELLGSSKLGPYYARLIEEYAGGEPEVQRPAARNLPRLGMVVPVSYEVYRKARARAAAEGKAISRVLEELIERDSQAIQR